MELRLTDDKLRAAVERAVKRQKPGDNLADLVVSEAALGAWQAASNAGFWFLIREGANRSREYQHTPSGAVKRYKTKANADKALAKLTQTKGTP